MWEMCEYIKTIFFLRKTSTVVFDCLLLISYRKLKKKIGYEYILFERFIRIVYTSYVKCRHSCDWEVDCKIPVCVQLCTLTMLTVECYQRFLCYGPKILSTNVIRLVCGFFFYVYDENQFARTDSVKKGDFCGCAFRWHDIKKNQSYDHF